MKTKLLMVALLAIGLLFFLFIETAMAVENTTVDVIQAEVTNNKEKTDSNNSRIQGLEADLATEVAAREFGDSDLQNQIDDIQLLPGLQGEPGPAGPPGISSAFCSVSVAPIGGDFTTIQDAVDSLNPATDSPCTVLVASGTYMENILITKSHIHLMGAGIDSSTLKPADISLPTIEINGATNVKISGFSIEGAGSAGIYSVDAIPTITKNRISNFHSFWSGAYPAGIYCTNSSLSIQHNNINENDVAIYLEGSKGLITDNTFTENGGEGAGSLCIRSSQMTVSGNTFTGGEALTTGFEPAYGNICTATITNNVFKNMFLAIDNNVNREGCFLKITGNTVTGPQAERGFRNGGPAIIAENKIENCALEAIFNDASNTIIANNLLFNNGAGGSATIINVGSATISGNILADNGHDGISTINGVATISGNTFVNTAHYGVTASGKAVIMSNLFDGTETKCVEISAGSNVVTANLCGETLSISGAITITSEKDLNIHAAKNINMNIGMNVNIATGENLNVGVGQDLAIAVDRDISTSAENTTIGSNEDTTISSGNDTTVNTGTNTTINTGFNTTLETGNDTRIKSIGDVYIKGVRITP